MDNVDTLQEVAEVAHAWPASRFYLLPVETEDSFSDDATAANWSVHWATGVDKAHAAGNFGKGVKVAVIDSGVDYNHPAVCASRRVMMDDRLTLYSLVVALVLGSK